MNHEETIGLFDLSILSSNIGSHNDISDEEQGYADQENTM
jgi:hypothetical protein